MKLPTSYQLILLCLQITSILAAPLLLLPVQWLPHNDVLTQETVLQKQLMELQAMKRLNIPSPFQVNNQLQPLVVLLPNEQTNTIMRLASGNDKKTATRTTLENEEDLNSIVIDAATESDNQVNLPQLKKAILLVPNGRLSLGDIISGIPFLPIEINVPDTIAWAYNGISSGIGTIISIIGRPFQGMPQESATEEANLRILLKQIQMKNQRAMRPMIMMPIDGPVLPIQV